MKFLFAIFSHFKPLFIFSRRNCDFWADSDLLSKEIYNRIINIPNRTNIWGTGVFWSIICSLKTHHDSPFRFQKWYFWYEYKLKIWLLNVKEPEFSLMEQLRNQLIASWLPRPLSCPRWKIQTVVHAPGYTYKLTLTLFLGLF